MSKALRLTGGKEVYETAYLIEKIDKYFDSLNVSSYTSGKRHRKPFQQPYRSSNDFRLSVSIRPLIFIYYLFVHLFM